MSRSELYKCARESGPWGIQIDINIDINSKLFSVKKTGVCVKSLFGSNLLDLFWEVAPLGLSLWEGVNQLLTCNIFGMCIDCDKG